jgi:filamentous hemagglutinin
MIFGGLNQIIAGAQQTWSGVSTNTPFNEAMQSFGMSPEAAGLAEAALGLAGTGAYIYGVFKAPIVASVGSSASLNIIDDVLRSPGSLNKTNIVDDVLGSTKTLNKTNMVDDVVGSTKTLNKTENVTDDLYDSRAFSDLFETRYGKENVTSSTLPTNPSQRANSSATVEVLTDINGNKAVKVEYVHPLTGEAATTNIAYDSRGLPVFDDVTTFTTTINKTKSYEGQMRQATRDLRDAINSGKFDAGQFTPQQLQNIQSGAGKIQGYTWHHNAQAAPNSMQLVPKEVHEAVLHTGQAALNK